MRLWRWDGFVVRGEINNQSIYNSGGSSPRSFVEVSGLKRKTRNMLAVKITIKSYKNWILKAIQREQTTKRRLKTWQPKAFIDSQQLELEFSNKKERLIEIKNQL